MPAHPRTHRHRHPLLTLSIAAQGSITRRHTFRKRIRQNRIAGLRVNLEHLRIYATPLVLGVADTAYDACWRWGNLTQRGADNDQFYAEQASYDDAELTLYDAIRRDLMLEGVIQSNGRPLPGSG